MPEEEPKDVEHVVAIICQRERMDDGIKVHYRRHEYHCRNGNDESWETATAALWIQAQGRGKELVRDGYIEEVMVKYRYGEECEVRPDVEHLG